MKREFIVKGSTTTTEGGFHDAHVEVGNLVNPIPEMDEELRQLMKTYIDRIENPDDIDN